MRNQDKCIFIFVQITFQPFNMTLIKIVSRLIKLGYPVFLTEVLPSIPLYADLRTVLLHLCSVRYLPDRVRPNFTDLCIDHIKIMMLQKFLIVLVSSIRYCISSSSAVAIFSYISFIAVSISNRYANAEFNHP